jgi:hypothetical protein
MQIKETVLIEERPDVTVGQIDHADFILFSQVASKQTKKKRGAEAPLELTPQARGKGVFN